MANYLIYYNSVVEFFPFTDEKTNNKDSSMLFKITQNMSWPGIKACLYDPNPYSLTHCIQWLSTSLKTIHLHHLCNWHWGIPRWCSGKESACQCRRCERHGSISGSRRSPGEGNGNHFSILAWKIPWTEEPGRLQSLGLQRVGQILQLNTHT